MDLSLNLKAVVSQRLIKSTDGQRVPAVEIMLLSTFVAELIQKGDIHAVKEAMEQGTERGMQTFDQALYKLYKEGKISLENALGNADSRNNLSLRIRLDESGNIDTDDVGKGLSIGVEDF
jgi:twitching motility protein PilU